MYFILIRPVLEYACEELDGCYERDNEQLEKIQLEAARIVTSLTEFASQVSLYLETWWKRICTCTISAYHH